MIGFSAAVSRSSSRCATSPNVRSRTSPITACRSSATALTIQVTSYAAVNSPDPTQSPGPRAPRGPPPAPRAAGAGGKKEGPPAAGREVVGHRLAGEPVLDGDELPVGVL